MAGVSSVTVFGNELTREFAEIEVSDEILAKLKGNPSIEVLVRKPVELVKPSVTTVTTPQPPVLQAPTATPVPPAVSQG